MSSRRNIILLLTILAFVTGFLSGRVFWYRLGYGGVALITLSWAFSWFSVNWLQVARHTYFRRIQVGQVFEEQFIVRNRIWLPKLWLEVQDHSNLPNHAQGQVVPLLLRNQAYRWQTGTVCVKRGQFTLGPMSVIGGDPFGLYQFPRHIGATSTILVYPRTYPIYDFATPIGSLSGGQAVRRMSFEVTPHAAGIRDYAPGDSFKRIHWRTSARRGKLYVKEFEMDPLGDVWIFLDLSAESLVERPWAYQNYSVQRLPASTEEYGVTIAASLAQYFIENSRIVGFLSHTPRRQYIAPDRGDRQLTDIMEVLAMARSETQVDLAQMLALEASHITKGSTVIVITSSTRPDWLQEAHIHARRGILMLAVLVDPGSFGKTGTDFASLQAQVEGAGVMTYPVCQGDDLTKSLSYYMVKMGGTNGNAKTS
jgi:uncharacterized protein (DUF58 family)